MNSRLHNTIVLCLICFIALSGCALTTGHVNPNYTPQSEKKSPLSTISPLRIAVQVEDQRPSAEQDRVADKKNGFGGVTAKVLSDKEPKAILYDAVKAELEHNAHTVVKSEDGNADVVVKIAIKRYWSDFIIHFFDIEMKGTLDTNIAIFEGTEQKELVSKPFNGMYRESRQIAVDGAFESALNGALLEFIRGFSRDPILLDALRSVALRQENGGSPARNTSR